MSQFDILDKIPIADQKRSKSVKETKSKKTATPPPSDSVKPTTRQPGKSKDDRFYQIGPYVKKATYIEVKKRLVDDHKNRDLSDLVEELLSQWISQ